MVYLTAHTTASYCIHSGYFVKIGSWHLVKLGEIGYQELKSWPKRPILNEVYPIISEVYP
jgi:hypothetical protein